MSSIYGREGLDYMKLSVIMPCYNEINTIDVIVASVRNVPYHDKEIIIVDDCSTD
jgi:glycosyltransferase involved in cell wall biosynthesis